MTDSCLRFMAIVNIQIFIDSRLLAIAMMMRNRYLYPAVILDSYLLTIVMMKILVRLMVIRREKNIIRPLSKLKDVQYHMCGLQRSSKFHQVHHLFFGYTSKTDSAFTSNTFLIHIFSVLRMNI